MKKTLADLLHDYEVEVGQRLKSRQVEVHYFNQLRRTQFAQLKLDRLKPADIQRWVNERSSSHRASSTVRLLGVLSRAFNHAIKHHGFPLPFNPIERVIKPRIGQKTIRRIPSRLAKLLESPACRIGCITCFAVETAMRRSEIAKLEWADVDLERRLVHAKKTKNGHDRSVPLSSTALVALGQFKQTDKAVLSMSSNAIRLAWGRYKRSHGIDGGYFIARKARQYLMGAARGEDELAEEEKRIVSICRKTSVALQVELHVDNEIPRTEWIEILDSYINPALASIDEYYFKDIFPDKLLMPEDLKLKPVHYAKLYTHKT